jgi:ATP-dependent Clp protease adaptor protein ClpS
MLDSTIGNEPTTMSQEQSTAAAVAEPEQDQHTRRKLDRQRKPKRQPRYHVVLWDDPNHTFQYVMVMMQELFAHPLTTGFELAETVHNRGKAIVLTTTLEHAELKRDQIRAYGSGDAKLLSKGSMYASIEPECGG